jgi:prevent-host-death family protein
MKKINVHHAKTHLSAVLAEIEKQGERYLICRNGRPIADLVPHEQRDRLTPHPVMKQIAIHYDPTESLSEEEWPEES